VQLTFTNTAPNSLKQLPQKDLYSVFPNPASNELHIVFTENTAQQMILQVTDISGRAVLQHPLAKGATQTVVSVGALPEGVYFLHSSMPGTKAVSFIKQ